MRVSYITGAYRDKCPVVSFIVYSIIHNTSYYLV